MGFWCEALQVTLGGGWRGGRPVGRWVGRVKAVGQDPCGVHPHTSDVCHSVSSRATVCGAVSFPRTPVVGRQRLLAALRGVPFRSPWAPPVFAFQFGTFPVSEVFVRVIFSRIRAG